MSRAICLFAGSFDPVTNGHLSLIRRAASRFDKVFVAVMRNPAKQGAVTVGERLTMLAEVCAPYGDVRVLAEDMSFLMKSIALGKEQIGLPEAEPKQYTNFIR